MMASEKAKELAARQKAEARAEKLRRKNSTDPADWGQLRQIRESYKVTAQHDKPLPWILLGAGLGTAAVFVVIGLFVPPWWMWLVTGLMAGLLVAMLIFVRRAKGAAYKRYEGQAGSAEVALQMLPKKWSYTPVITATRNRNSVDVIHRAIGPGGLILIGEGDAKALKAQLASEKRKHEQVSYGVVVQVVQMGKGAGQVPLDKLVDHIKKLPKQLSPAKVVEVQARLRALDAMRPKLPIPKGPLSTKGSRQAMRGR
ncbi:DUF4191 domain-containing protein [Tessaracoccus rhinocerotis]|uniref:DUF4191 domain-containing protein n=1 Tax=Tessaracoccus rhinocerotis TaxID=1689449 RepID=A0A553K318_9ACTN|nr:DUF4191 domain-containing protein [Tessaracoccus rhinocerotis]TRY19099.1 DUF4191 domain-containing protein [Tessaracoccus rhinocerotis]